LEGEIEHYDSQQQGWSKLAKGGAQVIRSGSGISHAEKLHKGTHMFQIWLDPDLSKSMNKPASYDDYNSHCFTFIEEQGCKVKIYAGEGGPMKLDTPGVEIVEIRFDSGDHIVKLDIEKIHSIYLLDSLASIGGEQLEGGDFVILSHKQEIRITAENESAIFMVSSPLHLGYRAYSRT
jgi:redox-sensitive bicupin YhaK (pirin superfamily)